MAPWPEQSNEPKAPDKNSDNFPHTDSVNIPKVDINPETLGAPPVDSMLIKATEEVVDKEPCVSTLDEDALKDLLDEAMSYKCPKDVVGKSRLFKELLQSVETDKKYPESMSSLRSRPNKPTTKKSRRRQQNRKDLGVIEKNNETTGQDFIQPFVNPDSNFNKGRGKARLKIDYTAVIQCEGGSQSTSMSDEAVIEDSSLKCSGDDVEIPGQNPSSKSDLNKYRCDFSVHVSTEPLAAQSTEKLTPNVNGVEQQVPQVQLPTTYNSVKSLVGGCDSKNVGHSSGENAIIYPITMHNFNVLSITPPQVHTADSNSTTRFNKDGVPDCKKTIDENGNSLANRVESSNDRKVKKSRLNKLKNDKNTIMSQNIEGHRSDIANSDIDAVIKYIESPTGLELGKITQNTRQSNGSLGLSKQGRVSHKMRPVRDKSSEVVSRKGRRTKESKLHKYNSLEEISTTKLEDLTNEDADSDKYLPKQATVDDLKLKTDRTWELSNPYMHLANDSGSDRNTSSMKRDAKCEPEVLPDSEFHIVTKKQRKKKKSISRGNSVNMKETCSSSYYRGDRSFHSHDAGRRDSLYRYSSQCDTQRRKSASSVPPSDKSADSSDLDSVHSLPVSSTTQKALPTKKSTSSGSTPQASYADITRSVSSPPHGNSNVALHKSLNLGFLDGCKVEEPPSQPRTLSPDNVPTVVVSLPQKNSKSEVYKENMDKDYPPLDQMSEKKKPNDMFVEFTVLIPKPGAPRSCDSVNVEETVIVKSSNVRSCTSAASESLTFVLEDTDHVPSKRPPVILMNEEDALDTSAVTELVFGFEVNQQLLVGSEKVEDNQISLSNDGNHPDGDTINTIIGDQVYNEDVLDQELNEKEKTNQSIQANFNHDNIVDFISGEWNSVMNELAEEEGRGKIRFFDSL